MRLKLKDVKSIATMLSGQREISTERVLYFTLDAMNDLVTKYDSAGNKKLFTYLVFDTNEEAQEFLSTFIEQGVPPDDVEVMTRMVSAIGNWADLPEGCISVKRCLYSTNMNMYSPHEIYAIQNPNAVYNMLGYMGNKGEQTDDFITENGYIKFPQKGTYTIEYLSYYNIYDFPRMLE
ncbi:MAG: hypothetical protein PHF63_13075 [Herbinix sp.]|nr:hypothetical protein [Herbinix sp.]